MIDELTLEQKNWVIVNQDKYSWRRLAEEFDKVWPESFEPLTHEEGTDEEYISYSQIDGMWLCKEIGDLAIY